MALAAEADFLTLKCPPKVIEGQKKQICSVFTARHICIAWTMPWVGLDVCLSVRHTPVLCVNGYTYPQSLFDIG